MWTLKILKEPMKYQTIGGFLFRLFGKTIKEIWDDIYSEINPVLKWRKMEEYHQRLKDDVEKGEKELEEKKKIVQDLENKIKERKNGKD